MRKIFLAFGCVMMLGSSAQGKFFGGDGPTSYGGASLMISLLSVDYGYLRATPKESMIRIEWLTVSETNNDYFDLQLMDENGEYISLGKIQGNGTSSQKNAYEFIDSSPITGINYYRILQIDFDGKKHPSKIISAVFLPTPLEIYPNPVTNTLHLNVVPQNTQLEIYTVDGRLIRRLPPSDIVDVGWLQSGQYILRIELGADLYTTRFLKQ